MYRYVKEIFLYLRFIWCVWLWPRTSFHYSKRSHHKLVRPHSDIAKKVASGLHGVALQNCSVAEPEPPGAAALRVELEPIFCWPEPPKNVAAPQYYRKIACYYFPKMVGCNQLHTWQYVDGKIFCNLNNGALNIKDDVIVIETVYARDDGIVIYLGEGICLCWGKGRG